MSVLKGKVSQERAFTIVLLVAVLAVVSKHPRKVVSLKVTKNIVFFLHFLRTQIAFEFKVSVCLNLFSNVAQPVRL